MTLTIIEEYSKSTIHTSKNSAKTFPKLTKTLKRHDRHCCGIPTVKFGQVLRPIQWF